MKRGWYLALLLPVLCLPINLACHVDAEDDDDDMKVKVDTKGEHKGIEIDKD